MEIHICLNIYWQLALKIPSIESDFKVNIDIVIKIKSAFKNYYKKCF